MRARERRQRHRQRQRQRHRQRQRRRQIAHTHTARERRQRHSHRKTCTRNHPHCAERRERESECVGSPHSSSVATRCLDSASHDRLKLVWQTILFHLPSTSTHSTVGCAAVYLLVPFVLELVDVYLQPFAWFGVKISITSNPNRGCSST